MKKNLENYQTHSSRVSFLKHKYGLYMKRAICFFPLRRNWNIAVTSVCFNSVLSRHDYTVYTAITHLRNIYLVSKMLHRFFYQLVTQRTLSPMMIHIICLLMTFSSLSRLTHKTFEERAGGGGIKEVQRLTWPKNKKFIRLCPWVWQYKQTVHLLD